MPPSPAPAWAARTQPELKPTLVIGLPIVVLILAQTWLPLQGMLPVLDGELGDPDSYMRLFELLEPGS